MGRLELGLEEQGCQQDTDEIKLVISGRRAR